MRFLQQLDRFYALTLLLLSLTGLTMWLPRGGTPLSLLTAVASWLTRSTAPGHGDPLTNAKFTRFTDWEGPAPMKSLKAQRGGGLD